MTGSVGFVVRPVTSGDSGASKLLILPSCDASSIGPSGASFSAVSKFIQIKAPLIVRATAAIESQFQMPLTFLVDAAPMG